MDFFRHLSGHPKKFFINNHGASSVDKTSSLSSVLEDITDLISVLKSTSNPPVALTKMLPDLLNFLETLCDNEAEIANRAATAATVLNVSLPSFSSQLPLPTGGKPRTAIDNYKDATALYIRRAARNVSVLVNEIRKSITSQKKNPPLKVQRSVNKTQLHLSVLYQEIKTFFPHHSEQQSQQHSVQWKFKCAKLEAQNWWTSHFGDWYFVEWDEFNVKFRQQFAAPKAMIEALNFAQTDYISKYVFDLFTRLFSPWDRLVDVWTTLTNHPGYMGMATYDDAKDCLATLTPGSYLFRFSSTKFGFWSIAYVKESNSISQALLKDRTIIEGLTQGVRRKMYLYPNGKTSNPDISHLLESAIPIHLEDVYGFNNCGGDHNEETDVSPPVGANTEGAATLTEDCDGEWSKMCKICFAKEKDTQMEPCLHCMCRACLNEWMNRGDTCPWCREPIRSIRRVVATVNKRKLEASSSARESPTFTRSAADATVTVNLSNQSSPTQMRAVTRRDNVPLPALPPTANNQEPTESVENEFVPPLPPRSSTLILPPPKP